MGLELWTLMGVIPPSKVAARARQLEGDGWDGMSLFDSQALGPETMVCMTAAALATDTLKLTIATSNPITRHPSVAAAAMMTLTEMVGSRVRYGIGRGDASQAFNGGAPASFALWERYITAVCRYFRGEPVPFEDIADWRLSKAVSTMSMAHAPDASRLTWTDPGTPAPPVDVAATGPRALEIAGRLADRVMLGLGAHVGRIEWALELARAAREKDGQDPRTLTAAIPVSIAVTDDLADGRRQVSNLVATSARFAIMSGGAAVGPTTAGEAAVYRALGGAYDMRDHAGDGAHQTALTDEFIDDYAIVGPPQRCVERILELHERGVDAFQLLPPMGGVVTEQVQAEGYRRVVEDVIPEVRRQSEVSS